MKNLNELYASLAVYKIHHREIKKEPWPQERFILFWGPLFSVTYNYTLYLETYNEEEKALEELKRDILQTAQTALKNQRYNNVLTMDFAKNI